MPRIEQMVWEGLVGLSDQAKREDLTMPAAVRKLQVDRSAMMKCQDDLSFMRPLAGASTSLVVTSPSTEVKLRSDLEQ